MKFKIGDYISRLKEENLVLNENELLEIVNKKIYGLSCNSQDVKKESLFICKGNSFKEEYLNSAIAKGAILYMSEKKYNENVPCILVSNIRRAMAVVSNLYYSDSREKLNIIGITGTKGKSTTAYYIKYILDEMARENVQKDTGILSSIKTYDGKSNEYSLLTTPESIEINERFYNMVNSGIKNVVMEVSSQGLKYDRTYGIDFNVGVFLNISEDHISSVEHSDFEDYFSSKLKIFKNTKIACINLDADFSDRILSTAEQYCKKVITFSTKNGNATVYAKNIIKVGNSTRFEVVIAGRQREYILNMPGIFNVENALAAISVAYSLNVDERFIYSGLKMAKAEGRMEIYSSKDDSVIALVDYAHNKLSFEKVFESVKQEYKSRKIVSVFGCPGNKALNRRVDLPTVADSYSDKIYLTADDPGSERIEDICKSMACNIKNTPYEIIEDRGEAIKKAIEEAGKDSIVLVLGKGAETLQKCGNKKEKYLSDVYYVKESLKSLPSVIE